MNNSLSVTIHHHRYHFWFDLVRFTVGILLNFHYSILIDEQIEKSPLIFLGKWLVTVKICFLSHTIGNE